MKRFWSNVTVAEAGGGWQVSLDDRALKTQGGAAQIVPTRALADALAGEWRAQGDKVDAASLPLRDMADFAIDQVAPDPHATVVKLLQFADTDTVCYRADPDEPLWHRQREVWEPLLVGIEESEGVRFERISGVGYRPIPDETQAVLMQRLAQRDPFTLAALQAMASLAASLCIALEAECGISDPATLFAAANLEEDWQAQQWGWDDAARTIRDTREAQFVRAANFLQMVRPD